MKTRSIFYTPKPLIVFATGVLLFFFTSASATLTINAGSPQTVCKGATVTLGGNATNPTASGGTAPYNFSWSPTAGMSNPNDSDPTVTVTQTTMFHLIVTDAGGGRVVDSVLISISPVYQAGAGNDTSFCPLTGGALLGNSNNSASYTYSWTPVGATGLSCYNCPRPTATPTVTTTYSVLISDGTCSDSSKVVVTVLATPTITATSPVTVKEGSEVVLNASGGVSYTWLPDTAIYNQNTATPTVSPNMTITYTVVGKGADGCPGYAFVVVDVIPDSNLTFYNTFTPNGDGINDTWFVGNLLNLYPSSNTLTVFNRYGKQVYYAQPYLNNWDGTSQGANLPDATYYYILSTGSGKSYKGSITIIRKPK